jgi:hypothetical protein
MKEKKITIQYEFNQTIILIAHKYSFSFFISIFFSIYCIKNNNN